MRMAFQAYASTTVLCHHTECETMSAAALAAAASREDGRCQTTR